MPPPSWRGVDADGIAEAEAGHYWSVRVAGNGSACAIQIRSPGICTMID
jgi:hypothetical protein